MLSLLITDLSVIAHYHRLPISCHSRTMEETEIATIVSRGVGTIVGPTAAWRLISDQSKKGLYLACHT